MVVLIDYCEDNNGCPYYLFPYLSQLRMGVLVTASAPFLPHSV